MVAGLSMANPNVYNALIQPMRSVGDYEDQMSARKLGAQRNALLEMQMQQQQQGMQRQQAVGSVFQKYGMSPDTANELLKLGAVDEAQQVQKALAQQASQQSAMQQQQARQQYLRSLQPTQAIDANRASGVTGPRPEALGVVGQRAKFDPAQALQVMSVEEATKLQGLIDPRAEVKDYQQVRMPDGSVRVVGLTKDGKVIETGQQPFIKPEFQRFGNYVGAIDPVSLKTQNVGGINMSAAEAAADARARQGLALQGQRLSFDREKDARDRSAGAVTGKPLTEAQAKASTFSSQMQAAERELDSVGLDQSRLRNQADVALASSPLNILASDKAQRVRQAQEQWAEAFLRFKTGAATTEAEVKRNVKTFFPQQGDSAAVIEQKRHMRNQAVSDVGFTATGRQGETPAQVPRAAAGAGAVVDFGSLK
jgi:hypothetical protein